MQAQYFSRDGAPLSAAQALDKDGILKDGVICRTRLTMRDGARDMPRFTDADLALCKPGFRGPNSSGTLNDYLARHDRRECYRDYNDQLTNAWRSPAKLTDAGEDLEDDGEDYENCERCQGTGEVGRGVVCPDCGGDGTISAADAKTHTSNERGNNDARSIQQKMHDHATRMNDIYADVSRDLEQEWRKK
jgi:hypothetical protein